MSRCSKLSLNKLLQPAQIDTLLTSFDTSSSCCCCVKASVKRNMFIQFPLHDNESFVDVYIIIICMIASVFSILATNQNRPYGRQKTFQKRQKNSARICEILTPIG